jgi:energy-coupling factor transport system permease protein
LKGEVPIPGADGYAYGGQRDGQTDDVEDPVDRLQTRDAGLGTWGAGARALSQAFGLLVLSIRRATKLATAMEARGFGSGAPRSQARISRLKPIDWIFYVICLAVPLASIGVAVGTGNWHFAFQGV